MNQYKSRWETRAGKKGWRHCTHVRSVPLGRGADGCEAPVLGACFRKQLTSAPGLHDVGTSLALRWGGSLTQSVTSKEQAVSHPRGHSDKGLSPAPLRPWVPPASHLPPVLLWRSALQIPPETYKLLCTEPTFSVEYRYGVSRT